MKAPEKIYLDEDESWHLTNPNGDSVEYIRTDVFIEKATEWFRKNLCMFFDSTREENDKFIYNFKKAMTL
jgi:hypothetical protein